MVALMFPPNTGATASKVPANNPAETMDLTSSIVVSGLNRISTEQPTLPGAPYVVAYDVQVGWPEDRRCYDDEDIFKRMSGTGKGRVLTG